MRNNVQLCTYVDRFGGNNLSDLNQLLSAELQGLFGGVHLLPFYYPIDGSDAGFDPIDHTTVDNRLGTWGDVADLAETYDIVADLIVNHVSASSQQFTDFQRHGRDSDHAGLFLTFDDVFPNGATEENLLALYRPRPGLPLTRMKLGSQDEIIAWTTFTSQQLDINVKSDAGKDYLESVLDALQNGNVKMIRLDAAGYAVKTAGSSCFMTPETFEFIDELAIEANKRNMTTLVEIHAHHQTQIEIAKQVDWVYDFALPPLTLHTLYEQDSAPLQSWYSMSPRNAITVLDTHDGIGIIDIAPDNQGPGLLSNTQIKDLVDNIHDQNNGQSRHATGEAASNVDLYQVNVTFYEALGCDDHQYLLARLIQFFSPGIPQVYYVGFLAGRNDMDLLERTGTGRDINRSYYSREDVRRKLEETTVQNLIGLIHFRNSHPAFSGEFSCHQTNATRLHLSWFAGAAHLDLEIDLTNMAFTLHATRDGNERIYTEWDDFNQAPQ